MMVRGDPCSFKLALASLIDDAGLEFKNPIPQKRKLLADATKEPEDGCEPEEGRGKNAARLKLLMKEPFTKKLSTKWHSIALKCTRAWKRLICTSW